MPAAKPPDIVFLAAQWQPRALIRAQLIEEGFEVVATASWAVMRRHLRPGSKPRLAIVDLNLPDRVAAFQDLQILMKPDWCWCCHGQDDSASRNKTPRFRVVPRRSIGERRQCCSSGDVVTFDVFILPGAFQPQCHY
jgi:hypothetical protein